MVASKKVLLTDRFLKTLKPASAGKREIIWDAMQPHLGVRITDKGKRSFVVVKRQAGERKPTRHFLGTYPTISLVDARIATPKILSILMDGGSPKAVEQRRIRDERKKKGETFGTVAQEFLDRHVSKLKSARSTELVLKRELLGSELRRKLVNGKWTDSWIPGKDSRWRDLTIAEITRRDVIELLEKISDGGSRYQARKVFAILSKMFNWALLRDTYGLEASPIGRIRYADILGKFTPRSRILTDEELRSVWSAAVEVGYPFGTLVQALMLTGQRLRELSNASLNEISEQRDLLIIPASRMKGKIAHTVPLTPKVMELLVSAPRFESRPKGESFVFSTTHGKRPFSGFAKSKTRLEMAIKQQTAKAGSAHVPNMPRWTLHDLRRTVRTRLSGLGVLPLVAELVIGHKQTGIQAVYDLHTYDREKRVALELWQDQLLEIVGGETPPPNNVTTFHPPLPSKALADVANI